MSQLTKEDVKKLARNLMFDLSDAEITDIQEEFTTLMKQLELLDVIDTEDVIPMVTPFETPSVFLREDSVSNVLEAEDALLNAPKREGQYFVIPKVVKE